MQDFDIFNSKNVDVSNENVKITRNLKLFQLKNCFDAQFFFCYQLNVLDINKTGIDQF